MKNKQRGRTDRMEQKMRKWKSEREGNEEIYKAKDRRKQR
jgi:hypothetical protein